MALTTRKLAPLLFGSGMCALIFQIAWFRELRMVFGASTAATAAVLAIFIAGLGAGGLVLGGRADRHARPVLFYGQLSMLERYGTRMTLWIACVVNLVVALAAQRIGRRASGVAAPSTAPEAAASDDLRGLAPAREWSSLAAAGIVGFAFFLVEMVWYRMLGPILGGTVFTFGLILAVALLGIGLGGVCYASFGKSRRATLLGFAATCLFEALLMAVPYALGDHIAVWTLLLRSFGVFGFSGLLCGRTIITLIVVLPAAFVAGIQFPLLIALLGGGREHVRRQIGLAYAFNTVGAIVGSLSRGCGLLPALTAPGCWRAMVWVLAALGLAAAFLASRARSDRRATPVVLALLTWVAIFFLLRATGPTAVWRHSPIGVGRVEAESTGSETALRGWMNDERRSVRWQVDDVESSVALSNAQGWPSSSMARSMAARGAPPPRK